MSNIMSTLLTCQCDSVIIKVCGKIIPVVQETHEAGMNWVNVEITKTICCSLVLIVTICTLGLLAWIQINHHARRNADVRKRRWEEEDRNRKQDADRENRKNMLEDEERKRKAVIIDKKLQILCETCYNLSKDEPKKVVKKHDDEAVNNYIRVLDDTLNGYLVLSNTKNKENNE